MPFPHSSIPLLVGRPRSLAAVDAAEAGSQELLLITEWHRDTPEPLENLLSEECVLARIRQVTRMPNGTARVLVDVLERAHATEFDKPWRRADAEETVYPLTALARILSFEVPGTIPKELNAKLRHTLSLFEEYVAEQRRIAPEIVSVLQSTADPAEVAFGIAAHLQVSMLEALRLRASQSLETLLERTAELLVKELEMLRLERTIDEQVRSAHGQGQRDFYLQEQLRAIHRELGNNDGDDIDDLDEKLSELELPTETESRVKRELRRLRRLSPSSPETAVSRGWLDWIAALPWHEESDDTLDIEIARDVLDADHHGLAEVKERILDHIAVLARVGVVRGSILCLVGPPGVGKTSLARSIARAMSRKFVRISLGGVRDEAEIRGHRRTYVGAMPGRILQAMRRAEVVNPVLLLDELDKLGSDWRGDPAAALLEVLDPEQNSAFSDHYLEVDYDLSKVLFITTANSLQGIPEALRDRLEIVRLPGYLEQEKLAIASRYLVPRQLEAHGLAASDVEIDEAVITAVLRGWTREAGVRELERRIARLVRKITRAFAEQDDLVRPFVVSQDALQTYLGVAPFDADMAITENRVGVANGLAYTNTGGEVLEVEVSVVPGRGRLQLTGTLGDVMKESASASLTWVRSRAESLGIAPEMMQRHDLHVHVPAGATPKDGPSAGIAIATAMVSALTGRAARGDVAMTGEVTLRGRVLPIGGLREKGVAAHRHRMSKVIVPHANARELSELPEDAREGVVWQSVKSMDEVLEHALLPMAGSEPAPKKRSSSRRSARHRETSEVSA